MIGTRETRLASGREHIPFFFLLNSNHLASAEQAGIQSELWLCFCTKSMICLYMCCPGLPWLLLFDVLEYDIFQALEKLLHEDDIR